MYDVLLAIQVIVTIALIGVVLIQRSEGGGLGIGSSQGMGSFMSGRGTANLLTRATGILAAIFLGLSMALAILNHSTGGAGGASILNTPLPSATIVPAKPKALARTKPAAPAPAPKPATPAPPPGPVIPH